MANRVTAQQWNQTKKRTANAMANQFFADVNMGTQGISDLLNQQNSADKLKNLTMKKNEVNSLLRRAEDMRQQYAGNKSMLSSVDSATTLLKNISTSIDNVMPQTHKLGFGNSGSDDVSKVLNSENVGRIVAENEQNFNLDMYKRNKGLSFDEISQKQHENTINMNDENRARLNKENRWLDMYKENMATDDDYKKLVNNASKRIAELKKEDKDDIYMPTARDSEALKNAHDTRRKNRENEMEYYQGIIDRYSDDAKYGRSNIEKWKNDVKDLSYSDKKKYIEQLGTNTYQKDLEKELNSYESGKEYINNLADGEKPSAQGFFAYLDDNNKNLYHEMKKSGVENPTEAKKHLVELEKKASEWKSNDDEIDYLENYAKSTANSYEDYKALNDEYQKKIDESKTAAEADKWKYEFSSKYGDEYLRTKQEHNFKSLPENEQQEMIDTIRKQYNTDSRSGNFNPYDSQSVENMKQYGRDNDLAYENRKLRELTENYGFTDSEAESIIAYAKSKVNEELQQKEYEEYYKKGEKDGKIGPGILGKVTGAVASTLQSVPYSLASGIGAAETIWTKLKQGFGGETPVDYNSEGMRIGQRGSAIREGAKSNYDEIGQFIYDAFASTVDSAATLPIDAVVPGATAIILGSSAATQSMLDGHEKGLSDAQAIGQGVAAGIFEGLFEKVSLDKIIEMGDGVSSVKGMLSNIAKSVGIEGSEEGFTEIANILYDDLANGELSDYKTSVSDYREQGYSQSEAKKLAKKDLAVRIAQSVGGGALGGAFMGIPVSGYNYAKNKEYRTMAKTGDAILRNNGFEELQEHIAQNYDEESNLYKQMANTDINDSAQVGFLASLAAENEYNQAMESYSNTVNEAVSNRLQELNVPKQIADNMAPTVLENRNVDAGQYQETYNQVKQELMNGITGREDNWVSDIDLTDRDNHLENARTIEKLAVGESLRKGLSKSVANDVKSKIDEKRKSGELSANGTAHLIDNPDVEFTPVELIVGTDGETQVIANNGSNYKMSDVAADANTVAIAELGEQYEPEQRKKFFKAYEQTGDVLSPLSFASYFNMAYDYGKNNLGQASVFNNSRLRNNLTLDQIGMAYDAGKLEYIKNLQKNKADTKTNIKGTVSFDGVDESRLNETQKSAVKVAKVISKAVGCKITFFESGKNQEGKYVGANGSYNSKTNELRIDINAGKVSETEGHNIMILTLSHELTHYAENFAHKEYAELQEFVFDVLSKNTGKDIKELIAEEMEHQRRQNREHGTNIEVTESRAKSELVARGCELVLTDAETIRELAERNRGLFGKIKAKIIEFTDSIINACKEILGKDGNIKNDVISKEAMQMKEYAEKLRTLWNEAVGAAGESNAVKSDKNSVSGGVREMIRYDSDNNPFVEIDKDIFKGVTNKKERIKLVKEAIRDSFSTGIEIDEGNVWSSGKTRKEFTDSKYSNWLKRKHKIIYTRKLRMAGNADEIVKSVKKYSYETPLHPRKDNLIGFYRGDTKIRIGKFDYTADVILALDSSNKMYFYDIINIENTKIEEPTEPGSQMNENNKRLVNSSINSISRNSENDNNILKQDRNTDVIKKAANKLGVSERFLESNLEGRSRESAVQYLRNNNQVKNSFISEKGLEVTPVLKEPTSSYGMSDNIKEFVRDNNISYKTLSENSRLREEYAKLIEHSKDGSGKKFLVRIAQDKAQEFIEDINEAMSGDTEAKEKISREIELAKDEANAYDDGMSMERGQDKLIKEYNTEFEEFISSNIAPMYNNAERNKKEFAQNVKDNVESYVEKAEKHFGTTNDYSLAAYIDINGKMLDFSDGGAIRGTDHRGIAEVLDTPSGVSGTEALTAFMNAGNIRIMDTGIDISVEPNEKQISVLRDYIASRNGEIYIDFSKEDGSPAGSARYSKGTSVSRILADINNYFEDGTIPENTYNAMSDFLYQDRRNTDSEGNELTLEQQEYFKDSKVRDDEGRLMVMYHQTGADFTVFNSNKEVAGKYDSELPTGYFLKTDSRDISVGGNKQMKVYANITNPLNFNNRDEAVHYWKKEIPENESTYNTIKEIDNEYQKKYENAWEQSMNDYKETWNAMKRGEITEEEFNERITTQDKEDEILQEWEDKVNVQKRKAKELINDFVKEKAIDGIIVKNDVGSNQRSVESYIAFNSNQIKNVTNENPTNNEDIRYQARINAITDAESMTQDNGIASYTEDRLEDLYTDYAAMNEDYSQAYLTRLSPEEFLKLTTEDDDAYNRIISESTNLDKEKLRNNSQPIYLRIYDDGEVRGHEGRHRMAALMNAGITSVPVVLIETSDNYGKEIGNIQRLDSQDFSFGRRDYSVKLGDSIPITRKNDALIREKFLNSGDVLFQDRTISPRTYSLKLKDNVNFKDGRQNADEMYRKTKGVELSDRAIDMLVKKLEKDSGTNVSSDVLHKKLKKTFENARTKDLTGNELVKELRKIAAFALNDKNDKQRRTTYAQNILNEVRKNKVYVTERQRSYLKRETGLKYEEWRRSMFGKVNLTNNVEDGVTLDAMWQEYSRLYPEVFKSDVKVEEQPLELEKITFALSNEYANNYGFNFDDAALYCATELMATYSYLTEVKKQSGITTDIDGIYDKYQKDMSNVRVEYYNLNREYNKRYQGELNRLRKEWRDDQKYHEQNLRQKYASMIKQREADIRNREDSVWTTREKEKVRNHIIKTVKSISNMIVNPSNQRHAPEGFKSKVAEFCQQFLKDTSVFQYDDLDRLKVAYEALRGDNDSYSLAGSYDSDIDDMLTVLKNTIRNRRLSKLDRVELEQVKDIVDHFRFIIENENKIWSQGKTMNLERTGLSVIDELSAKKDKVLKRTKSEGVNSLLDKVDGFVENNYTPIYFFKKLGPTFEKLYSDVRKGQDDWGKNIAKATRRISDIKEKYNYDKWDRKRALKLGGGITLNTEQAMYIYATRQREMQNETQEARHLQQGGIIMEDRVTVKDGKVIKKQKVQQQAYKITDGDLVRLGSFLTMEQKAYVNELVNYLSVDMAKLGNETSMKLYGIKKFGESYYFPYKVAGSEISTTASGRGKVTPSLKNAGMTKALTKKAGNAIIVDDFTDTAARHISQMCTYNALAVAQDNINRIYNFKDLKWDDEAEAMVGTGMTVKQLLDAKEGEDAGKYLELFLASINNGLTIDPTEGLTNQLISKFKKGAVYASLSVAIQQPSAICRAFALVDPKYFAQTTFKKRDWEECKKYNGVAVIKELGGFDTGTGQGAVDYLTDSRADSKIGRTVEKIDNGLGRLPGYMDQITWCHIWNAVKAEIKDKYNFNGNEAEFFKKASERFDEVINLTQVYDSVLAKSVNMNSKSGLMKSATAFMSEPTVTLNMLNDALQNGNRKYICRAVSAIVLQTVVNAALKALVQAARNSSSDDEEKSYVEKYAKAFSGDVIGDINPLTWIPVVKDIVNIFQGYDVERADLSLITDLYNACQTVMKARDGKKSPEEAVQKMSEAIAAFFGVPLTNINRDIRGVRNLFNDVISHNVLSKGHVGRAFLEGLGITTSNADIINDYIDSGDRKEVGELIEDKKVEIKEKYPSYSDEKVSREAISGVRSLITKQLKSRYLKNPKRKSEIVDFMKKTKMYTEVKKKKTVDVSEDTVNGWLITELKKQYINSTDAGDRAEIKRQLWATKHWKRLRELEKQLKEWTE